MIALTLMIGIVLGIMLTFGSASALLFWTMPKG